MKKKCLRLLSILLAVVAFAAVGCGKTETPPPAPTPVVKPDLTNLITSIEAEDYTEGYSEDNWNQTGYYAEVNDGPIDITISFDNGVIKRYRAIFTNGDWATYTVNVETAGAYWIVVNGIGAGEFYLDDIDNPIPFECDDACDGIIANIMLEAGEHTLKIAVPTYLDMDFVSLYEGDEDYMTTDEVASYVAPAPVEIDKDAVQLEIYVSPDGSDDNSGKKKSPFATLARAREEVRKYNDNMTGNIIVHFAPGYYQLDEVEVFNEEDSGTNGYSIIYKGDSETESTLFSGGTKIEGWAATDLLEGKIWKASADIEDTRNLWINGYPAQRAVGSYKYMYTANLEPAESKYSNYEQADQPADVRSSGIKVPKQDIFLALEHPEEVELVWPYTFTQQRTPVQDIYVDPNDDSLVVFEMDMPYWEWANTKEADFSNPVMWDDYPDVVNYESTFYLENALALLDEPGEFYFDKTTKEIFYYPYAEEDLTTAETYAATTELMIQVIGSGATGRVENITFDNLEFRYGAWNEPNTTGVQITQTDHIVNHRRTKVANGGKTLPGQITFNFTRNVNVYNCEFRCLGSSALVMDNGVSDTEVVGNRFLDISGTAIMVDSYEHRGIMPEGRVRCDNVLVANNAIRRAANQYYGMVGISMYLPSNSIVRNNDVQEVPYSGIVAGWGWHSAAAVASANCKILDNKIVDVMKVMTDGGHIYTLDRVHNLEIAGNYCVKSTDWRGGIYLDAGSRAYDIYDNVVEDSYHWFFGGPGLKIQDIELFDNYYDAESKAQIDPENVIDSNNIAVERGEDGKPQWPQEALDIIAKAGVEDEYKHLLEGMELPEWHKDIIYTMPTELIRAEVKGTDLEGAITIQTESHVAHANTEAYVKNTGEAVRYNGGANCYSTWAVDVENTGAYTFRSIGTGMVDVEKGYDSLIGKLYVNGKLMYTVNLNSNERYNPWDNPLESVFGSVKLAAGTHVITFTVEGGVYIADRIELIPAAIAIEAEDYSATAGTAAYTGDDDKEALKYKNETIGYAHWSLGVDSDGTYTFSSIGTGKIPAGKGTTAITGRLFINDKLAFETKMNINDQFDPWENPLETVFGTMDLTAGTYNVRLEVEGGDYVMDKILVAPPALDGGEPGSYTIDSAGSGSEPVVAVTVEAEDYTDIQNAEDYIKDGYEGAAVKYSATEGVTTPVYTTWTMKVDAADTYTFKTIGTGMILTKEGYTAVEGSLYINDELKLTADMTTNERYNPWDNPMETELGSLELAAGTYTVRFEVKGGVYVLDKLQLETGGADDAAEAVVAVTVEAEDYTALQNAEDYIKDGYEGAAVKYSATEGVTTPVYTTWTVKVDATDTYTFRTIGTGMILTKEGYTAVEGSLYINDELKLTADMTTNERYNPWDNPMETVLGSLELAAGTYTVRFEVKGGVYVLDKLQLETGGSTAPSDGPKLDDSTGVDKTGQTGNTGSTGTTTVESVTVSATAATAIEAENYYTSNDIAAYEKEAGKAVKYLGSPSSTSYAINVETAGTYTFTAIGTGMQSTKGVPIMGNLYVDGEPVFSVDLVSNEKYNPWDNPLESLLGSMELTAGVHKVKFENVRGEYIMDKLIITPGAAE